MEIKLENVTQKRNISLKTLEAVNQKRNISFKTLETVKQKRNISIMVDGKAANIAIQPIPNDSLTTYYI